MDELDPLRPEVAGKTGRIANTAEEPSGMQTRPHRDFALADLGQDWRHS